eukprot:TRINITY_DN25050_c0_g1_i1.p1 TRINITY_DN25050_c0_g1~~TRINITY_DN25050_c0_g1_i1.p1  ORF type:complete len:535 (+),score=87.57 TRINITY_DN25050_c0_g1_i1:36-1607(+)
MPRPGADVRQLRVLFIIDTTSSMGDYCDSMRQTLPQMFEKIRAIFGDKAKVEAISYADYGDDNTLCTCYGSQDEVTEFGRGLRPAGGGDGPEAVKTALNEVCRHIEEDGSDTPTVVLLYTDAEPHSVFGYGDNNEAEQAALKTRNPGFDWMNIARKLEELDVTTYTLSPNDTSNRYYALLGTFFKLADTNPATITRASMALMLRGMGQPFDDVKEFSSDCMQSFQDLDLKGLTEEDHNQYLSTRPLHSVGFAASEGTTVRRIARAVPLKEDGTEEPSELDAWKLVSVGTGSRTVAELCAEKGLPYTFGCGYYEISRKETIQSYKILIACHEEEGTVKHGTDEVRKTLGLKSGDIVVSPSDVPKGWSLYVQSTSVNRKLLPGTTAMIHVGKEFAMRELKIAPPPVIEEKKATKKKLPTPTAAVPEVKIPATPPKRSPLKQKRCTSKEEYQVKRVQWEIIAGVESQIEEEKENLQKLKGKMEVLVKDKVPLRNKQRQYLEEEIRELKESIKELGEKQTEYLKRVD